MSRYEEVQMCRWFTSEGLKRGVPALAVCVQVKEGLTRGAVLEGARAGAGGARGGGRGGGALQEGGVLGDGGAKKRQAVRGLAGPAGFLEAGVAGQGGQGGRGRSTAGRSGRCWVSWASSRPGPV